jgi:hypothetical protein
VVTGTGTQRTVGAPGLFLVVLGGALVFVSIRYLAWYDVPHQAADSSGNITFAALQASSRQLGGAGVALAYFDWAAWALLIAVVAVGALSNAPVRAANGLRVLGFALGFAGALVTFYALLQHFRATGSPHFVLYNSSWGVWAALGGFLLAGVGAALGPQAAR